MYYEYILSKPFSKIAALLPASAMRHISYRVSQLIDDPSFYNGDIEDLFQELAVAVHTGMRKYKQQTPSSNGTRFFNKIIDNKISDFRRRQRRQNRGKETTTLFDDWDIEENNDLRRIMSSSSAELSSRQRIIEEVRDVLSTLPQRLQMFCELLKMGYNFEEAGIILGAKSVTLRTRRIPQIIQLFKKAGFISSEKNCTSLCGSGKNDRKNNKERATNTCWPQDPSSGAIVTSKFQSTLDEGYNTAVSVCSGGYTSSYQTTNLCSPQGIYRGTCVQSVQGIVFCSSNGFYSSTNVECNYDSTNF